MPAFGALVTAKETALPMVPVFAQHRDGQLKQMLDVANVPANFASGDFIQLGSLPSTAVILPNSYAQNDTGLGASRTLAFQVRQGTGTTGAVGGTPIAAAAAADTAAKRDVLTRPMGEWGRQLWQLAGFASDPGGRLTIEALLGGGAGPGSAWNLAVCIYYT
jgi:hypothetical protein